MDYRIEHDSMGEVKVPADRYWAAQTQRSHGVLVNLEASDGRLLESDLQFHLHRPP